MPWSNANSSWSCNLIFAGIAVILAIVLFPVRNFPYEQLDENVIDTVVGVYRHRDPLRMTIDKTRIPDLLQIGPVKDSGSREARKFIDDFVLPTHTTPTEQDAKDFYTAISTKMLSPLQVSMLLMGCYGYAYDDGHNANSTYSLLHSKEMWKAHTTGFLLQALEDSSQIALQHDRSACSCMKDFASPTLLKLNNNDEALDKKVSDKLLDSCTLQNTIDYSLDGESNTVLSSKDRSELQKSVMITALALGDTSKRQRKDPLYKAIEDAASTAGAATAVTDPDNIKFVKAYCAHTADPCIASWTTGVASLTNEQFFNELKTRVDKVKPHNKLRPPTLCPTPDACSPNLAHDTTASVSYATYKTYIEKYRAAFHMCSRAGVPQYTTLRLGFMVPHKVYNVGQCFLFCACLFSFTWSFIIAQKVSSLKEAKLDGKTEQAETAAEASRYKWFMYAGAVAVLLAWTWLLIAMVRGMQYWINTPSYLRDEHKGQIAHYTDETALFFFALFYAILGLFFIIYFVLFLKFYEMFRLSMLTTSIATASSNFSNYLRGTKPMTTKTAPFANLMSANTQAIEEFNKALIKHLQDMAPYAQVALDLSVIAALTILAVASVTQRGVKDINVISAVSVWFLTIGLIAHLSNMLRLLHVYLQWDGNATYDVHVQKAAHHRVFLGLLIAVMLFVYILLAGLDAATTTSSHTLMHQVMVAVFALFVLCGTDVIEELATKWNPQTKTDPDAWATTERFWTHLSNKNYYLAWIIVFVIVALQMHRAIGLCEAAKHTLSTDKCLFLIG